MEKTDAVALHAADARDGGAGRSDGAVRSRKAASRRGWRATRTTASTLIDGMAALGFKPFLKPELQAPIIVTFHAPAHPAYDFKRFYAAAKARGFILYPGKLTEVETFRVGCIGAIGRNEMQQAVQCGGRDAARDGHHTDEHARQGTSRRRRRPQASGAGKVKVAVQRHRRHPARQVPAQGQVLRRGDRPTAASASATWSSAGTRRTSATTTRRSPAGSTAFPTRWRGWTWTPRAACRGTAACPSSSASSSTPTARPSRSARARR